MYKYNFGLIKINRSKMGVSLSHKSTTRIVHDMGNDHDKLVQDWKDVIALNPSSQKSYVLIGGNLDKTVSPRNMRVDQNK